jgi:hypothetical protein
VEFLLCCWGWWSAAIRPRSRREGQAGFAVAFDASFLETPKLSEPNADQLMSVMAMLCQVRRLPTRRNSDNLLLAYDASLIGLATTRVPPAHHSKR